MTRTMKARYENGVFRPLTPPEGIAEGETVELNFEQMEPAKTPKKKRTAGDLVREFGGTISEEDLKIINEEVEKAFGQINYEEWK